MKINNFKFFNIQKQQEKENRKNALSSNFLYSNNISNPIYKDTFQKITKKTQEVSFKGEDIDDEKLIAQKYAANVVSYVVLCEVPDEKTLKSFEKKSEKPIDMLLIDFAWDCINAGFLAKNENFADSTIKFYNENGIVNYGDLLELFKTRASINNFNEIFGRCPSTFVILHNEIQNKKDLISYPSLAQEFYYMKENNPDMYSLEEVFSFLKKEGITNEGSSLDNRIYDLKEYFNNFSSEFDKINAVYFLMKNRDDELNKFQSLLDKKDIKLPAKYVYAYFPTIVDAIYLASNKQNFDALEPCIEDLIETKKIKGYSKVCLDRDFEISSAPANYFTFLERLKRLNITVKQYSDLFNAPFVTDIDPRLLMMMFNSITKGMAEMPRIGSIEAAQKTYTDFGDCISGILYNNQAAMTDVDLFLGILKKYKIKDSKSFADFYKKCTTLPENKKSTNKKKPNNKNNKNGQNNQNNLIPCDKMLEFVRLFRFDIFGDLLNEAKKQNVSPVSLLYQEEERFQTVKKVIDEHILKDEDCIFAGRPALDIYLKYKKEFVKNPNNIEGIVSQIAKIEMSENYEYELRKKEFNSFDEYFDSEEDKIKFIENSQIDLISEEAVPYKDACRDLLGFAKEQLSEQEYKKFSEFLLNSDFLSKSKYAPQNIQQLTSVSDRELLNFISDDKIPSIEQLISLLDTYKDDYSNAQNIINHLNEALKTMSFAKYTSFLSNTQDKINSYGVNIKIDNKNINYLPLAPLNKRKDEDSQTLELLKRLYKASNSNKELNLISALSMAFVEKNDNAAKFQIIQEILSKSNSANSQYENINRVFGLQNDIDYYMANDDKKISSKTSRIIQEKIPKEFFDFVNSDDWTRITDDGKYVNLILHAKLRLIERFALNDVDSIEDLDYKKMAQKLNAVLKEVYSSDTSTIKLNPLTSNLEVNFKYGEKEADGLAVFDKSGRMITIYPKRSKN